MVQVNRIYLIFNPVHFLVDSSVKIYKKLRAEYKPGYVEDALSVRSYIAPSVIYLIPMSPSGFSGLPPGNGRATLKCRYT